MPPIFDQGGIKTIKKFKKKLYLLQQCENRLKSISAQGFILFAEEL
jgi:hypothetical protein